MQRRSAAPDVVPFTPLADEYEMPVTLRVNGEPVRLRVLFKRGGPPGARLPFAPEWLARVTLPTNAAGQTG